MGKTKTAICIKRNLEGFAGTACLYRLSPPMVTNPWRDDGEDEKTTEYVVALATISMFSVPKTYVFASDQNGHINALCELDGSFKGHPDCDAAIERAGYTAEDL